MLLPRGCGSDRQERGCDSYGIDLGVFAAVLCFEVHFYKERQVTVLEW